MKRIVIILEGAADVPREELGDRTALQVARNSHAARLAFEGRCGLMRAPRRERDHRSEVLLGLIMGLPEREAVALQRGPLEACCCGHAVEGFTHAFCGNFVTMDGGQIRESRVSRLSLEETSLLARAVEDGYADGSVRICAVAPGRVVALVKSDLSDLRDGVHPALVSGDVELQLPQGKKGALVRSLIEKSARALAGLTLNEVRVDLGENPATHLWFWGGGPVAAPVSVGGAMLTNSPLATGFAKLAGMSVFALQDPWSEVDGIAEGNAAQISSALQAHDRLCLYVEAPREGASYGSATEKVRLLERLDVQLTGALVAAATAARSARVLLTTDNMFTAAGARAVREAPLVVWEAGREADAVQHFDEAACREGALGEVEVETVNSLWIGE